MEKGMSSDLQGLLQQVHDDVRQEVNAAVAEITEHKSVMQAIRTNIAEEKAHDLQSVEEMRNATCQAIDNKEAHDLAVLEQMNLGRLRIAAKGLRRSAAL